MIETTGMSVESGDRIVEIGAVEAIDHELTLRRFHSYVRQDRESDAESFKQHGLSKEFLVDKPTFSQIAGTLAEFIRDSVLIVQPCEWTVRFLDHEWAQTAIPLTGKLCSGIEDIVELAKQRTPGQTVILNALCSRYHISRPTHLEGTMLDA